MRKIYEHYDTPKKHEYGNKDSRTRYTTRNVASKLARRTTVREWEGLWALAHRDISATILPRRGEARHGRFRGFHLPTELL